MPGLPFLEGKCEYLWKSWFEDAGWSLFARSAPASPCIISGYGMIRASEMTRSSFQVLIHDLKHCVILYDGLRIGASGKWPHRSYSMAQRTFACYLLNIYSAISDLSAFLSHLSWYAQQKGVQRDWSCGSSICTLRYQQHSFRFRRRGSKAFKAHPFTALISTRLAARQFYHPTYDTRFFNIERLTKRENMR